MITAAICHEGDRAAMRLMDALIDSDTASKYSRFFRDKNTVFDCDGKAIGTRRSISVTLNRRADSPAAILDLYTVTAGVKKTDLMARAGLERDATLYVAVMSGLREWFEVEGLELMRRNRVLVTPGGRIGRLSLFRNAFIVNDLLEVMPRDDQVVAARYRALAEVAINHIMKNQPPNQRREESNETRLL
jgi:hypothetical protein